VSARHLLGPFADRGEPDGPNRRCGSTLDISRCVALPPLYRSSRDRENPLQLNSLEFEFRHPPGKARHAGTVDCAGQRQ
jgi:hypothetical protein